MIPCTPNIRRIVEAMVSRAIARCAEMDVPLEEFYRVLLEEQERGPRGKVTALFNRVFARLENKDH